MRFPRILLSLVVALLAAACAGTNDQTATTEATSTVEANAPSTTATAVESSPTSATSTTASEQSTTASTPSTTTNSEPSEVNLCDPNPGNSEVLCSTVDLIEEYYVDQIPVSDLAAAATNALETANIPAPDEGDEVCTVPTEDFAPICELAAENDWDVDKTAETATTRMISRTLDPNSAYIDPAATELFREDQQGAIEGIGALVTSRDKNDQVCDPIGEGCRMLIVTPFQGGPADESGLQPDDQITSVDGDPVAGKTIAEVTAIVRGPKGTVVTLGIKRGSEEFTVDIERAAVEVPVVESEVIDGVGYLRLNQFTANAGDQVRDALEEFGSVESIILDLRNNPGGLLDAAIEVTSQFTETGGVVEIESRDGVESYDVTGGGVATDPDLPLFVLINQGSASASEVLAGALGESGRATVVGENSFGKNTVQQQFPLPNDGMLKLTVARWHTPGGLDFGENGVSPDVRVELDPFLTPEEVVTQTLEAVG